MPPAWTDLQCTFDLPRNHSLPAFSPKLGPSELLRFFWTPIIALNLDQWFLFVASDLFLRLILDKVGTRRTGILETEAWNFQSLAFGWPVAADGTNRGEHDHVQLRIDMCTFGFFKSLRSTHLHNHRMKRSCVGCSSPKPWVCTAFRGMMTSWLSPRFFLCADARRPSNSDAPLNLKCACLLSLEGQDRKCNHPQTAISQQAQ